MTRARVIDADALLYLTQVDDLAKQLHQKAPVQVSEVRPEFFTLGRRLVQACGELPDSEFYEEMRRDTRALLDGYGLGVHEQLWQVFEAGFTFELGIVSARRHHLGVELLEIDLPPIVRGEADD